MQAVIKLLSLNTNRLVKFTNGAIKGLIFGSLSLSIYSFISVILEFLL
ncbi:MAG: hypothetical protein SPI03_03695 [Campylobacter sputorum]|nr:hypothetical protein [Campylobacter sputorum]MDY6120429.1 hypothetical protein [Campylobacter sputorum]